ncbi:tripartite motif-containing protein 2-like [Ptychodera flava]|uniref:tripartite motif-containing protein 2-like n=1 Tax=Ptychodera flava TaxID=63121 RepID=UPI00396A9036
MLSLETFVDYQEYLKCKEEITRRDISSRVSSEGAKSLEDLCDVELVSIMNMETETQKKEQNISIQWKQIEVKTETKDKLQSTVFSESQTFSESEKSCMDEWVTLKSRMQQSSDNLILKADGEKLKQQNKMLGYDVLSIKYITKGKVEELEKMRLSHDRIMKGIVPKDTVRRLSREGKGPGEVWYPLGLTINHNGQVVVSDNGVEDDDKYDDQPGSVKTVTADTAQITSTITFHGLPNIFRPRDVKMSKNNLYYIADDGNKCILVCDAKSRLKQIIDISEVSYPQICLGPDNTVFVADYNGRVIKYSKAGEMISSKQLSKPYDLTMNSKYQLIVSCEDEHCIYVLDSNLNTLHTFGHEHLVSPGGVSVDAIGENIYVADENKVKIFSAQGEYLTDVTVDREPVYIAVFADGRIVYTVSDDSDVSDVSDFTVRVIYT